MTIKEWLQFYEAEIVVLFAIVIGLIIACKVISVFVAGAKWRAAQRGAGAVAMPAAAQPGSVRAIINDYLVVDGQFDLNGIDEKTTALVLAIVANDAGIPLAELQFKSIKAIDG